MKQSNNQHHKQSKRPKRSLHGWIALDKPLDMSSFQAVSEVKRLLSPTKIGHGGTLDPLATGCLPLALGEATKTVPYVMDARKTYRFTLKFGEETDSGDRAGEVITRSDIRPSRAETEAILSEFTGTIEQIPPAHSALKINGKRACDRVRDGEKVVMKSRMVEIHSLQLLESVHKDEITCEVTCGKGTYIRSLARDIAHASGSCGHITALRRLSVGKFDKKNMISLENIKKMVHSALPCEDSSLQELILPCMLPLHAALDDIPEISINATIANHLRQGRQVALEATAAMDYSGGLYRAMLDETLVALIRPHRQQTMAPLRVFNY